MFWKGIASVSDNVRSKSVTAPVCLLATLTAMLGIPGISAQCSKATTALHSKLSLLGKLNMTLFTQKLLCLHDNLIRDCK